jgi:hypothetical protein
MAAYSSFVFFTLFSTDHNGLVRLAKRAAKLSPRGLTTGRAVFA